MVTHKTILWDNNTGTIILTSLRASCARARKDSSTPMMVIRINTMSTSVRENTHYYQASTQSLHLLEKIHIITKHQHKVYICQNTTTQKKNYHQASTQCLHLSKKTHIILKHQHSVYICQQQKTKQKPYHQTSTQYLHLLKKCPYFLSCNICRKIHYL